MTFFSTGQAPRVGEGTDYSSSSLGTTELWAGLSGLSWSKGGHIAIDLEKEFFGLILPMTSRMQWFPPSSLFAWPFPETTRKIIPKATRKKKSIWGQKIGCSSMLPHEYSKIFLTSISPLTESNWAPLAKSRILAFLLTYVWLWKSNCNSGFRVSSQATSTRWVDGRTGGKCYRAQEVLTVIE